MYRTPNLFSFEFGGLVLRTHVDAVLVWNVTIVGELPGTTLTLNTDLRRECNWDIWRITDYAQYRMVAIRLKPPTGDGDGDYFIYS